MRGSFFKQVSARVRARVQGVRDERVVVTSYTPYADGALRVGDKGAGAYRPRAVGRTQTDATGIRRSTENEPSRTTFSTRKVNLVRTTANFDVILRRV